MRLIDADALVDTLSVDPIGCAGCPEPEFMDELIDILDTAPTVEPTGDLIRRKDAIKAVAVAVLDDKDELEALKAIPSAEAEPSLKAIKRQIDEHWYLDAPSAEAVQGWIPCSERLPEKDELVLATVWDGVSIAWRNIYGGWESAEDMYVKGDVTAWMPLPKPYKGGEDTTGESL